MRASLALLGTYLGVAFVLEIVAVLVSEAIGVLAPHASLFVFLFLYMAALWAGWGIAVRINERMMPETDEERAARMPTPSAQLRPRTA
jgi:hypothetical protein